MKKMLCLLALSLGLGTATMVAQNDLDSALVVTEIADGNGNADADSSRTTTWTFNNGATTVSVDTTSIDLELDDWEEVEAFFEHVFDGNFDGLSNTFHRYGWLIAVIPILLFFVLPLVVIFLIVFFVYKGRKAKYKAYQQMAERGQDIPQGIDHAMTADDAKLRSDAVSTICVGVGLFILLGVIMDSLGRAIGALIFCIGVGKYVTYLMGRKDNKDRR